MFIFYLRCWWWKKGPKLLTGRVEHGLQQRRNGGKEFGGGVGSTRDDVEVEVVALEVAGGVGKIADGVVEQLQLGLNGNVIGLLVAAAAVVATAAATTELLDVGHELFFSWGE